MFAFICQHGDGKIYLVVLQGNAVSLRDERFELLEYSVCVVIPAENFIFS